MDGLSLKGKTALLTGASRGIGQAAARCLADLGANVILTARTQDAADAAAEKISGAVGASVRTPLTKTLPGDALTSQLNGSDDLTSLSTMRQRIPRTVY